MIISTSGDILYADTEAVVNTVNCVGVMGRGIALQFKRAWPENFKAYAAACKKKEVQPGKMFIYETRQMANPRFIINFPTKRHWRGLSKMEDIEDGLAALVESIKYYGIQSISIPPLGAGLGGLDWKEVRSKIEAAMSTLPPDIQVFLYAPHGAPDSGQITVEKTIPNMTPGRAVLVELMQRYKQGLLDPFISLLEIHKLMYFMQELGEDLKLRYKKAHYGPFAENLSHVLKRIDGHFISGYADGGDYPQKELNVIAGISEQAQIFLKHYPDTQARFARVSDLVAGFESPDGLELLATVHWVNKYEDAKTEYDIINAVHSWNKNKLKFTPRQINIARGVLIKHALLVE